MSALNQFCFGPFFAPFSFSVAPTCSYKSTTLESYLIAWETMVGLQRWKKRLPVLRAKRGSDVHCYVICVTLVWLIVSGYTHTHTHTHTHARTHARTHAHAHAHTYPACIAAKHWNEAAQEIGDCIPGKGVRGFMFPWKKLRKGEKDGCIGLILTRRFLYKLFLRFLLFSNPFLSFSLLFNLLRLKWHVAWPLVTVRKSVASASG